MPDTHWRVELHTHTVYSKDSLNGLDAFVRTCRRRGVDRVAVTDHNTIEGALALKKRAPELIVVGEEILTTKGELLAFFLTENVPPLLTPEETIRRLRDQGAFISVSHPFDRLRKGAWETADLLAILDQVDALEVFNARCVYGADNKAAQSFAAQHHKPGTVGSDAHFPYELARATLIMPPFEGAASFAAALSQARQDNHLSPVWVHGLSKYAKYMRKWGIRPMPNGASEIDA